MEGESKVTCRNCGIELPKDHRGPCPSCKKVGLNFQYTPAPATIKIEGHSPTIVLFKFIRQFWETNIPLLIYVVALQIASYVVGFKIRDTFGMILSVIVGVIGYLLSPFAITRTRETMKEIHKSGGE